MTIAITIGRAIIFTQVLGNMVDGNNYLLFKN